MLPEKLCLADLGLGHDDRAKKPQPVRSRMGERFFPWQLEQSVEDSWNECELHARNLLGESAFAPLQRNLRRAKSYDEAEERLPLVAEKQQRSEGKRQPSLFGREKNDE